MHSYKIGDKVTVHNQTLSGEPIVEGVATVRRLLEDDDRYLVSFEGERETYERHVRAPDSE